MGRLMDLRKYMQEIQTEAKKVTWPERKDTMQTTLMVVVMVVLVALFLWGVDTFLGWLIRQVY